MFKKIPIRPPFLVVSECPCKLSGHAIYHDAANVFAPNYRGWLSSPIPDSTFFLDACTKQICGPPQERLV
jgi:hypothetical protein